MVVIGARCAVALLLGVFLSFVIEPSASQAEGLLEQLLPSWPILDVGDAIPAELIAAWGGKNTTMGHRCPGISGHFNSFPSKRNRDTPAEIQKAKDNHDWDPEDPDNACDDGDQTTYNGMLCAAGISDGCRSIAQAQDGEGRFYRSPHRKWAWAERCESYKGKPDFETIFNDRCAYGFSPDMNLGVLLYTLKTNDLTRYKRWLSWLDTFASTTKLCKLEGKEFTDCQQIDWPRVCPEDMGNGQDPGTQVLGRYGGKCVLRPTDAMDFSVVNNAMGVAPPPRMNAWDIQSRGLITGVEAVAGTIAPIGKMFSSSPLVMMSLIDGRNFPAHLDALRVLIRMMILNPGLQLNNLPPIPDPLELPGILDIATSDSADSISINAAAKALALQDVDNPFYALLSRGPTGAVRQKIIDACPAIDGTSNAEHWIWEKGPAEEYRKKQYSMGWDCVFVGALYNRMRVRKELAGELIDKFLKLVDPTERILKNASQALQLAEGANVTAQKVLDRSTVELKNALEFVNGLYDQQRAAAQKIVSDLTAKSAELAAEATQQEQKLLDLRNRALTLPDTVTQTVRKEVCDEVSKYDPTGLSKTLCKFVDDVTTVANKAKSDLLDEAKSLESKVVEIRNSAIPAAAAAINAQTQFIAELDNKLQSIRTSLADKSLESAVSVAKEALKQAAKILYEARKATADAKRAYARLKGNLAVWKNDPTIVADIDLTPVADPAPLPAGTGVSGPTPEQRRGPMEGQASRRGNQGLGVASYYTIVASLKTRAGAERQARMIQRMHLGTKFRIIQTFGRKNYWAVTSGSYKSLADARAQARVSRGSGIALDAYILRLRR